MDVSVVTPSYNQLGYLKRCCASVADQEEIDHEHIVICDGSTDGSADWLAANPSVISAVQENSGMYNALNNGFRRATGEIISHLNCDEQYLPGTLSFVKTYFDRHPSLDVLFGDALTVRPDGTMIAFRKGFRPIEPIILAGSLYLFTCAMFIRRRVIDSGEVYDDSYRVVGDVEFIARLLRKGYNVKYVRRYLSVFTMTGSNLATYTDTSQEARKITELSPWWVTRFRPAWKLAGRMMKLVTRAYLQEGPIVYAIYPLEETQRRTTFVVEKASSQWLRS
jgi:glycosyltransferase involved in cell wall biosynthesis